MNRNQLKMIVWLSAWVLLACTLWYLRSWNLLIGDGEFCCKQTVGASTYPVTLSRAPFSHLLYRGLFFIIHARLDWWVEDIIALSSCAAGLVFFWSLFRLTQATARNSMERVLFILFPSTTLILQIFCGHIEFYPWTCALLMVSVYWSWKCLEEGLSPFWPSMVMMLATAFHTSGVFYFPSLLLLPILTVPRQDGVKLFAKTDIYRFLTFFVLFNVTALLHREAWIYPSAFLLAFVIYYFLPGEWKRNLNSWWAVYLPWLVMFTVRAFCGLRAEPLLEHLPPVFEPYDHGAYLYMAFSREHVYDKFMFHFWLAPFGVMALLLYGRRALRELSHNRWQMFLFHFVIWALIWTTLFYPQLRTRDWDLFASMSIPLNLYAVYILSRLLPARFFRLAVPVMILAHLITTVPMVISNSGILTGRGYCDVVYEPEPVPTKAFLRGLELLETTPTVQRNVRTGWAEIRMVPLERGYHSWAIGTELTRDNEYYFDPTLKRAEHLIIKEDSGD